MPGTPPRRWRPAVVALGAATAVAVAGTVTTLAAVRQALPAYDASRVHGGELGEADLEALLARLGALTVAERARLPGMEPKRADVIVAGCAVVLEALRLGLGEERRDPRRPPVPRGRCARRRRARRRSAPGRAPLPRRVPSRATGGRAIPAPCRSR